MFYFECLLPIPPSVNNLFPTNKHGVRYTSKAYRAWKTEAERALSYQTAPDQPFKGRVSVEYRFSFKTKRACDIENFTKGTSDFLENQRIIENDNQIDRMLLIREEPGGGSVFVTLKEISEEE